MSTVRHELPEGTTARCRDCGERARVFMQDYDGVNVSDPVCCACHYQHAGEKIVAADAARGRSGKKRRVYRRPEVLRPDCLNG